MTDQHPEFDLAELAAEAAQQAADEATAHGPVNRQDVTYGAHGSHGSRSTR